MATNDCRSSTIESVLMLIYFYLNYLLLKTKGRLNFCQAKYIDTTRGIFRWLDIVGIWYDRKHRHLLLLQTIQLGHSRCFGHEINFKRKKIKNLLYLIWLYSVLAYRQVHISPGQSGGYLRQPRMHQLSNWGTFLYLPLATQTWCLHNFENWINP